MARYRYLINMCVLLFPLQIAAELLVYEGGNGQWIPAPTVHRRVGDSFAIRFEYTEPTVDKTIHWYSITPIVRDYDNTSSCRVRSQCPESIGYSRQELPLLRGRHEVTGASFDFFGGPGTYWLQAETTPQATTFNSRGKPPGLEIVVRHDDTYTGYLTELLGVPFVHWPQRMSDGRHQTDARLGADCVALVIYGQRRLGNHIPYMAPSALTRYTEFVSRRGDGQQPIRVGDILHFGYQTAVVLEDRAPLGILNDEDLIIHTYHTIAEALPFQHLPYRTSTFKVYRWPRTSTISGQN